MKVFYISEVTKKDSAGRQRWTGQWWADNIGVHLNQSGWRGQCFAGFLNEAIENLKRQDNTVKFIEHPLTNDHL